MTIELDQLDQAKYLVTLAEDNATVLCEAHRQAFELTAAAMQMPHVVYELPQDEEPITCQACHLASLKQTPRIIH